MKKAVVLLANGFEETEALSPVDYMRRAGIEVTTLATGCSTRSVEGSHKITVMADMTLDAWLSSGTELPDCVVVPGGMPGTVNISNCSAALSLISQTNEAGKTVAAICAAPALVLSKAKVLDGKKWTCYQGMEEDAAEINPEYKKSHCEERVVKDGNVITSRGAGTAEEFSLSIIECLCGNEAAETLKSKTHMR